jgi:hypothetical protein
LWRLGGAIWCPYLYAPLFDFLRSVPLAHLLGGEYHQFHTDAISRGYPETAAVPYAAKDSGASPARLLNWRIALEMGRYAARQPFRLMARGFLMPRVARALVDPSYMMSMSWILPFAVFMIQLEALQDGRWDDL